MSESPPRTRFVTPLVGVSYAVVILTGLALVVVAFDQAWRALAAMAFVSGAGAVILTVQRRNPGRSVFCRRGRVTRGAFIIANVMLASSLALELARALGWFGAEDEPGRWTIEWLLVALAAAAVEVLSSRNDRKDGNDPET